MITSYVCVDVETTGLNPKEERIIEIGAVKVMDNQITETFQSFIQPGRKLEQRIVELTGITDELLEGAPLAAEVMGQFKEFCGELPLMGHNLQFDFAFIKRAMVNEKLAFEKAGIDTLRIARQYLSELESRNLGYLCKYFSIEHIAHRALGDAIATSQLYEKLCQLFYNRAQEESSRVFLALPMNYSAKREQPITIAQKEQVIRYCKKLGITLERDINLMTRPEASRFIEKYRLEYIERNGTGYDKKK